MHSDVTPDSNTPPQDSNVPPRDRDRAARRTEILNAARTLFIEKGYDGTTMAEIARGAGFAVGTLYKFFKDKYKLYDTLVADAVMQFEHALTATLAAPARDEVESLVRFTEIGTRLFREQLPIIRVYYSQTGAAFLYSSTGLQGEAFNSYDRILESLTALCERGIQHGVFANLPAAALAGAFEGVHNAFLGVLVRDEGAYTDQQIIDYTLRIFLGTVLTNPDHELIPNAAKIPNVASIPQDALPATPD